MSTYKSCIYDNPATMCREVWENGKLQSHISVTVLSSKSFPYSRRPWEAGKIIGSKEALEPKKDEE